MEVSTFTNELGNTQVTLSNPNGLIIAGVIGPNCDLHSVSVQINNSHMCMLAPLDDLKAFLPMFAPWGAKTVS